MREIRGFAGEVAVETRRGAEIPSRTITSGVDCLLSPWSAQSLTAPVVFAGYGIREPMLGRDDYAGLDVRGKSVLILRGAPDGAAWRDPALVVAKEAAATSLSLPFDAGSEVPPPARLSSTAGRAALDSRPRRTLVFAFWTGEEDGKLGSGHYVRHPLWPLARTAAYVSLDMIGHPWPGLGRVLTLSDPPP